MLEDSYFEFIKLFLYSAISLCFIEHLV